MSPPTSGRHSLPLPLEDGRNSRSYETGTLRFDLVEDDGNMNRFYLNEAYRDPDAFLKHTEGRHFARFFAHIRGLDSTWKELFKGTGVEGCGPTSVDRFCGEGDYAAVTTRKATGTSPGLRARMVAFPPATSTHWHPHQEGQILWTVSGTGWLQLADEEPKRLLADQGVFIGGGRRHWHGATTDSWLEHLAITVRETSWFEPSPYPERPAHEGA
jgi:quercetin dioxygenase-like cupin family protein